MKAYSYEDLQTIPDVGPKVAESIYSWFHDNYNLTFLEKLNKVGIQVEIPKFQITGLKLQGKLFVFTGEMEHMSRGEAKEKVRALGGDISESVSKKTRYVVAGEHPGSKYDKAKKLGVDIIDERGFLRLVSN